MTPRSLFNSLVRRLSALLPDDLRGRMVLATLSGALLVSLLSAALVGGLMLSQFQQAQEEKARMDVRRVAENRKLAVESHLQDMEKGLQALAASPDVARGALGLKAALQRRPEAAPAPETSVTQARTALAAYYRRQPHLEPLEGKRLDAYLADLDDRGVGLQYQGLVDTATRRHDPDFWKVFEGLDPYMRSHQIAFPWQDLLLLDPEDGRVLYAAGREADLGVQVTRPSLAEGSLAEAFQTVLQQKGASAVAVQDFAAYLPRGNRPVMFLAAPVLHNGQRVAVLAAQVLGDDLDRVLAGHDDWASLGLGPEGDAFLSGPDRTLRTSSRHQERFWRKSNIPFHDMEPPLNQARLPGAMPSAPLYRSEINLGIAPDLLGEASHHAVIAVDHPQLDWELHALSPVAQLEQALAAEHRQVLRRALLAGILGMMVTGLLALTLSARLSRPIIRLARTLKEVEQTGRFDTQVLPNAETSPALEIRAIQEAVESLLKTLEWKRLVERSTRSALETEKTRLQTLDREHQTLLHAIGTHALVSGTDLQGQITYVNERFQQITGYKASEVLGKTHALVSSGLQDGALYADLWHTIQKGQTWHGELCNQRKDGSLYWIDSAIVPARDNQGVITGYTAVSLDVTTRKEDAARLHASLATLRSLLEAIPYPVFLKDRQSRYVECNDAFCLMLNQPRAAILGSTAHDLAPTELADAYLQSDQELYASESGQQIYESSVLRRDGEQRQVLFHKQVHRNQAGEPEGLVGIVIDITEFKKTEQELRLHRDNLQELVTERTAGLIAAKDEAERANHAKSEFLANITHELRTPLHAILSFARLAQKRVKAGDPAMEYLEDIHGAGQRQLALVNDLLDLSKIEAGKMTLNPHPQDLRPLLEDSQRGVAPLLEAKGISLVWEVQVSDTRAWVDSQRIQQVFTNLLSNAIKFSPAGSCITLALRDAELPRGRRETDEIQLAALALEVRDQGVGVPEDELESIFDKFIQSRRTNTGAGGTGLGLPISREIMLAHRGRLSARNDPEGGAVFTVILPRHDPR